MLNITINSTNHHKINERFSSKTVGFIIEINFNKTPQTQKRSGTIF